jgi:hypothetical protein
METKGLLPGFQDTATGSYAEPEETTPLPHAPFI